MLQHLLKHPLSQEFTLSFINEDLGILELFSKKEGI